MNLSEAHKLCLELMELHGLTSEKGWEFKWLSSKKTAGQAWSKGVRKLRQNYMRYSRKDMYENVYEGGGEIRLSSFVTANHSEAEVRDTILHEIAHALTPGHNHDYVWQMKAIEIGSNGQRCYDIEADSELAKAHEEVSKIIGTCPTCSKKSFKTRMPKGDRWCRCSSHGFQQNKKIVYVLNTNRTHAIEKPCTHIAIAANNPSSPRTQSNSKLITQPADSYKRMLDKFEIEFMPWINYDKALFEKITMDAKSTSTTWRTLNRETRKACNVYVANNNIMSHREFQNAFFYEGVMINRKTWGKNAPWL